MGRAIQTSRHGFADALFAPVQQRVLGLVFGQPDRSFQSAELIRLVGGGTGAAHRFLTRLADAGLVVVTRRGNQKHYKANRASPIFSELHGIAVKTSGLLEPLRDALCPCAREIRAAFVYGSVTQGTDKADSDVDLMIVSDALTYPDVFERIQSAETRLARPVNPNVVTSAEWRVGLRKADSFIRTIASGARLFVIGSADDLG